MFPKFLDSPELPDCGRCKAPPNKLRLVSPLSLQSAYSYFQAKLNVLQDFSYLVTENEINLNPRPVGLLPDPARRRGGAVSAPPCYLRNYRADF